MSTSRMFKLLVISLVIVFTWGLGLTYVTPTVSRAETIQIFATVGVDAYDFQFELSGPDTSTPYGPNSVLTYTLTYGSYLSASTDMVVLKATWSQGQATDAQALLDLLEYIEGSATTGLGGAEPVIDLQNRTITWQISPLPPGTDHIVSWQLRIKPFQPTESLNFSIDAALIGSEFTKPATPLTYRYAYSAPSTTVTPTPGITTTPGASPIPSQPVTTTPTIPGGTFSKPGPDLLEKIGPIIITIVDIAEKIAEGSGSLVVAPIPLLLLLIPGIAQFVTLLSQVPWWQVIPLLAALFWSKPKKPWGVVYDSVTKEPIDPAIITLINSKGETRTTLSDYYGRYQFIVEPGEYEITVKKANYLFPSNILRDKSDDGIYSDLYFGGRLNIADDEAIIYNIPLDPDAPDWNMTQKRKADRMARWSIVGQWLFWIGFIWSAIMFALSPLMLNSLVVGMYFVLLLLRWLQRLRSPWGVVYNRKGRPIAGAAVSVVDTQNPLVKRPPVVTNSSGRYAFLIDKGVYQVNVAVKIDGVYTTPTAGPIVEVKRKQGYLATDLTVARTNPK